MQLLKRSYNISGKLLVQETDSRESVRIIPLTSEPVELSVVEFLALCSSASFFTSHVCSTIKEENHV